MPTSATGLGGLGRGVYVDERFMPWGTVLADAIELFGTDGNDGASTATFRCRNVGNLAVFKGRLSAPALNRPVLAVEFELVPINGTGSRPADWVAPVAAELGSPASIWEDSLPPRADPYSAVVYTARWSAGDVSIGLSIYGSLRRVDREHSAGCLFLIWESKRAADPFLPEWIRRSAELAASVVAPLTLERFDLNRPLSPLGVDDWSKASPEEKQQHRLSALALRYPDILLTPTTIAAGLEDNQFAIWQCPASNLWGLSTRWDTMCSQLGEAVTVRWLDLLPAKGRGISELRTGSWAVYSSRSRCPAIGTAAERLKTLPGVTVTFEEGYDC